MPDGTGTDQGAPPSRARVPSDMPFELACHQVAGGSGAQVPQDASRGTGSTSMHPTSSGTSAANNSLLSSSSSEQNDVPDPQGQQPAPPSHSPLSNAARVNAPDVGSTEDETPELREAVPGKGPTTGGPPVLIVGDAFPCNPLYVRFGSAVTNAVSSRPPSKSLLQCE